MNVGKRICDRCEAEIKNTLPFRKLCNTVEVTTIFGYGTFDYSTHNYDLCKKCAAEFEEFMKGAAE